MQQKSGSTCTSSGSDDGQALAEALKITLSQAQFVLETETFQRLHTEGNGNGNVEEGKQFRLRVKRRLVREDKELRSLSKADMQRELGELYETQLVRYRAVLKIQAS
jgi:hypothetical protein